MTDETQTETQPTQTAPPIAVAPPTPPSLADKAFVEGLFTEYGTNGKLSDETAAKLTKIGVPMDLVEDYIQSKQASQTYAAHQAENTTARVYAECGGKEAVDAALAWAQQTLPPEAVAEINKQLANTNPEVVVTAVKGLQSRSAPMGLVPGQSGGNKAPVAYENEAQWQADLRRPEYRSDPAVRAEVETKLKAAIQAGKINTANVFSK